MIDFNTVLNTLLDQIIEQASKPPLDRIEKLEEKLSEVMTSDLKSDAFHDAVLSVLDVGSTKFSNAVGDIVNEKIGEHERAYDHDDFLTEIDASDVRDAVRNLTFTVEVD